MSFRPQSASLGYGWPTVAESGVSKWITASAIDRYPVSSGSLELTSETTRVDVSNDMTGLFGEIQGPITAINHAGDFSTPVSPNTFFMGLLALQAGASKTAVKPTADNTWIQEISPDETDVVLLDRYITFLQDITDENPRLFNPASIKQTVLSAPKGERLNAVFSPMVLRVRYYDISVLEAGTPANKAVVRGWLDETNNAKTDRKLFLKVSSYADPVATMLAGFGATPTGPVTFSVTAGLDAEGNPFWTEVVDSDGLPAAPGIGRADVKFEMALLDNADVTLLDEISLVNPIPAPVIVRPTTPTFTASAACLIVDGVVIADIDNWTLTLINDLNVVPGGACSAMPGAFERAGVSTAVMEFQRKFVTFRHETDLHDDAEFEVFVEARTNQLVHAAGVNGDVFDLKITLPAAKFSSGQSFKALSSATDTDSSYSVSGSPTSSTPQWKAVLKTDFADIYA